MKLTEFFEDVYMTSHFEENELSFFEKVHNETMHFQEMKVSQLSRQIAAKWKEENFQFSNKGSARDKYNQIIDYVDNACRTGGGTTHNFENDLNGAHNQVTTEVFAPLVIIDAAQRIADEFNKDVGNVYRELIDNVMPGLQEKLGISEEVMKIIKENDRLSVKQALAEYANQHH